MLDVSTLFGEKRREEGVIESKFLTVFADAKTIFVNETLFGFLIQVLAGTTKINGYPTVYVIFLIAAETTFIAVGVPSHPSSLLVHC